ncbi:MAG: hypothetical protein ACRELE_09445 [Gemmatimonadales bacterium]
MSRARLVCAALGILLAIAAIARDDRRIAWAAMALLAVALVLGLMVRRRRREESE